MGQRKLANKLINPKEQFDLGFRMVAVGIMAASVGFLLAYRMMIGDLDALQRMGLLGFEGHESMRASINSGMIYLGLSIALVFALMVLYGVWISHRVFGPMIPIRRHIRNLIEGNYAVSITLRKDDAFQDLANDLNELAAALEKKSP